MIDEKIILQELDEMIKMQQKSVEQAEQESNEAVVYLESKELAAYMRVRNMIKEKCTSEAATPEGADINNLTQVHYSTDQKKSEIRELAVEILNLSLQLQENADERIVWREKNKPCVNFRYYGATSGLSIKIWKNGFDVHQLPDYSTSLFLDDWNCVNEARQVKEILTKLLEESEKEQ